MIEFCRAKGLDARVADFLGLGIPPASFDAVYALNCLLHVPTPDLPRVHPEPRYFAFRSDERMRQALAERFHVLSFTTIEADGNHFQSFVLEKPRS